MRRAESTRRSTARAAGAPLGVALIALCSACLPFDACVALPKRPRELDHPGVRVGAQWLASRVYFDDARLGAITHIRRRSSGEFAVVGQRGAAFLAPDAGAPSRFLPFAVAAGHAELLEWPGDEPRYLDRGGGGWRTGGLIGHHGRGMWQPDQLMGMDDLAAGDLDGDGIPEFVVGYNGDGGIHLLDAAGRRLWQEPDSNVWHVEIVDTDGDGKAEIVHSNAAGQVTIRDATGKVLRRTTSGGPYVSGFSLVEWPRGQIGILNTGEAVVDLLDFGGVPRLSLVTPNSGFLNDVVGALVRVGSDDHVALVLTDDHWERTQLFVFDIGGRLQYREVLAGTCSSVAPAAADGFLLGCGVRVYEYVGRKIP